MKNAEPADRSYRIDEEVRVHVLYCRVVRLKKWAFDNLSAPYWRLYWNNAAGASIVVDSGTIPIQPDQVYLIPPNTPFASRLKRTVDHFHLHFVADPPYDKVAPCVIRFPVVKILAEVFREAAGTLAEYPYQKKIFATKVLFLCYYALSKVPPKSLGSSFADRRVAAAIARMRTGFEHPAANDILAREANMHPGAFMRLFKQVTGVSPHAYAQIMRIEQACRLLHFSADSIDAIAAATGFCDRYHFSRVFKKIRGISPAHFRRLRSDVIVPASAPRAL